VRLDHRVLKVLKEKPVLKERLDLKVLTVRREN